MRVVKKTMWIVKNPNGFYKVCWVYDGLSKIQMDF